MSSRLHDPSPAPADALAAAAALAAEGRFAQAIELLTAANRRARDADVERHLVALRVAAFDRLDRSRPHGVPALIAAEPSPGPLREHEPGQLTVETLRSGLASDGCVLVRGLVPRARAEALARGIDRVLDAFDAHAEGTRSADASSWFEPFDPPAGHFRLGGRRNWVRASGAVWTVESPRMLFELCALLDDTGIGHLVTEYLGERPALSANKCTLRRVPVDTNTNWHQDGAFLGADVRSVNLWLALSDCGSDSPGLEIVPRRLDGVLPTGTEGAIFDWSVSPVLVDEASRDAPVVCPEFRAGDALLFDHMLLHRTAVTPGMTRERYAMETWLFAPSSYPDGQIPVVY